jgi:hypothetical protein
MTMRDHQKKLRWSCYYSIIPTLIAQKRHYDHVTTPKNFLFLKKKHDPKVFLIVVGLLKKPHKINIAIIKT